MSLETLFMQVLVICSVFLFTMSRLERARKKKQARCANTEQATRNTKTTR
ncbi:hypothetical protein VPH49_21900 [Pseudomonas luteola]